MVPKQLQIFIQENITVKKKKKSAKNEHICLVAVLQTCFIRRPPAQEDHFWVVPRVVAVYRFHYDMWSPETG